MGGDRTRAAGKLACASAGTSLFDPTGISQLTFLAAGTSFLCGSAFHACRKGVRMLKQNNTSEPQTLTQTEVEVGQCIRKLSSALLGLGITGTLSFVLPTALAGVAINGVEATVQCAKLRELRKQSGSKVRQIIAKDPARAAQQIILGLTMKSATSILFLGSEVDTFLQTMSDITEVVNGTGSGASAALSKLVADHQALTDLPIIPGEGELHHDDVTWCDNQSNRTVVAVGVAAGSSDIALARIVEVPLDA